MSLALITNLLSKKNREEEEENGGGEKKRKKEKKKKNKKQLPTNVINRLFKGLWEQTEKQRFF